MSYMMSDHTKKVINGIQYQDALATELASEKRKIRWLLRLHIAVSVAALLIVLTFSFLMYPKFKHFERLTHTTHVTNITSVVLKQNEEIATLYALDPIACSYSFEESAYGKIISNWSIYNQNSDIDFNSYDYGNFTVGVEGGRVGVIIDLGSNSDLQQKYKYEETVGHNDGYASIHKQNNRIVILRGKPYNNTFQTMNESIELFRQGKSLATVTVKVGHIYILRITDTYETNFERIVKLIVLSYRPGESVTFRWQLLI